MRAQRLGHDGQSWSVGADVIPGDTSQREVWDTLQTRQFTPKDGSQRTVYEVVARTVHQITKTKATKELPADNDPQVQTPSIEPGVPAEVEANAEVWPS